MDTRFGHIDTDTSTKLKDPRNIDCS